MKLLRQILIVCCCLSSLMVCNEKNQTLRNKKKKKEEFILLHDADPQVATYFNYTNCETLTGLPWNKLVKDDSQKQGAYFLARALFLTRNGEYVNESFDARVFNERYFDISCDNHNMSIDSDGGIQHLDEASIRSFARSECTLKKEPKKHHSLKEVTYYKVHPLVFFQKFQPEVIQEIVTLKLYVDTPESSQ
ncbi:hypothetical protein Noda2021_11590 [Candidatus Dependentiae bacterium Noda2021]|nr:hypothetical protein Noda2021_11590 [Candidatus Dependentiae bacterium Noda2021]